MLRTVGVVFQAKTGKDMINDVSITSLRLGHD